MSEYEVAPVDAEVQKKQKSFPIPSDPVQKEKIMKIVRDVSGFMAKIDSNKDLIKEQLDGLSKEHQIPKRILNKFVKAYHKNSFAEDVGVNEEFMELTLALQPKAIIPDLKQERPSDE